MNFLYPFFLIAAAAVAVPVIIHLFNFKKYKKVYFPDIRFLREIQEQTRKHSQLKNLLILACRILTILFLVIAFAQPFLKKNGSNISQSPKAISIFIDNSFSMGIEKNSLSMLDIAKGKAKEMIELAGENDRLQILTHDFNYTENKFLSKNEALRLLSTLQITSKVKKAESILEKQKQLLSTEPAYHKQIVFISDFQKNGFPSGLTINDSIKKFFISVNAGRGSNLAIDTAYLDLPALLSNEENTIHVKLSNNSEEESNTALTLNINNQIKSVTNTTLKAGESKIHDILFTPSGAGTQNIQLFVNDYPMSYDDTFFISGKVNANFNVLILNQSNTNAFLSSVFRPGKQFNVDNFQIGNVNTALFKNYSLIVLNSITSLPPGSADALNLYLSNGGNILNFAPQNNNLTEINAFLSKLAGCTYGNPDTNKLFVSSYNKSHELFRDLFVKTPDNIDLPVAYRHFPILSNALSNEQKLFSFSNGDAFLSMFKSGNGKLYLCASSAESNASSFPKSYWFLPLVYKMAYSNASGSLNALTLGKNPVLLVENNKMSDRTIYHIYGHNLDAIPAQKASGNKMSIDINNAIFRAGFYTLKLPEASDTTSIAVNYDRSESVLDFWQTDDLKKNTKIKNAEWIKDSINLAGSLNSFNQSMPLWKVCIILALLFLLAEIIIIRFMK